MRNPVRIKLGAQKITEAMRLVYYELAQKILCEQRQVIPCYAGISNVHINFDGEVWPCCVLGYDKPMGNIRDVDYDFWKVWHSDQAQDVRRFIKACNCACPLANQAYSDVFCHIPSLIKAFRNAISAFSINHKGND